MAKMPMSPYIRLAWDSWLAPDWFLARRVIFDYEIICLQSGELDVEVDGVHYSAKSGDIILLRPKQPHSLRSVSSAPVHQPHIHFDLVEDDLSPYVYISFADLPDIDPKEFSLFRTDVLDEFSPNLPPVVHLRNSKSLEGLLFAIIHEKENRMIYSDAIANGLFIQFFSTLLREVALNSPEGEKLPPSQNIAQQVRDRLNRNLDRDISLDELSESIHISKYHLCRQFKLAFGVSPMQYHLDSRINKAKVLLVTTNMSISSIAETVGFQSIYSFSRAFKKRENVSPSVYRR